MGGRCAGRRSAMLDQRRVKAHRGHRWLRHPLLLQSGQYVETCSALHRPDCSASSTATTPPRAVLAHPHEHLRHHPVATAGAGATPCISCSGSGMVRNGAPLRSAPGFRSMRRDVMHPVVERLSRSKLRGWRAHLSPIGPTTNSNPVGPQAGHRESIRGARCNGCAGSGPARWRRPAPGPPRSHQTHGVGHQRRLFVARHRPP